MVSFFKRFPTSFPKLTFFRHFFKQYPPKFTFPYTFLTFIFKIDIFRACSIYLKNPPNLYFFSEFFVHFLFLFAFSPRFHCFLYIFNKLFLYYPPNLHFPSILFTFISQMDSFLYIFLTIFANLTFLQHFLQHTVFF